MRRAAYSLIELLVVIAIMAVLVGLVLSAVQSVRASARKTECANNLRQVGLALHHFHDQQRKLPAGVQPRRSPYPCMTWCTQILPYLEQSAAWEEATADYKAQLGFARPVPHRNLARRMAVFECPAGSKFIGTTDEDITAAFTYYLGVVGSIGQKEDGLLFYNSAIRLADVRDGASNTVMVGERPPDPDNHFGWWYAGVGMSDQDGSADSVLSVRELNRTYRRPTCLRGPYHFQQGSETEECDIFFFWSEHRGGAHFVFADGSVRFLRYSADEILPALASRNGGETIPAWE